MYRLTPRMLQRFRTDLGKYHGLFTAGRCAGWEQEELIVNAIKSDTKAAHHVLWKEAGHDDQADIRIKTNEGEFPIQIKSGQEQKEYLVLSGHRLGRFGGDFEKITEYLNNNKANVISISYSKLDNSSGRHHNYHLRYIDVEDLTGISPNNWDESGRQYKQTNGKGVLFSLRPSMSWQIWWSVPLGLTKETGEFTV